MTIHPMFYVQLSSGKNAPIRIGAGDIVCCDDFEVGVRMKREAFGTILVAWQDLAFPECHVRSGNAEWANDPSRKLSKFVSAVPSAFFRPSSRPATLCA